MALDLKAIQKRSKLLPPRIMLYGPHGLGKTTFGASAPNPVFVLTEDGLGQLDVPHFPLAEKLTDVTDALEVLQQPHDYGSVVLDSLDWLDTLIWQDIDTKYDAKELAYGKGAVIAADYWRGILNSLNALRNKGMVTILLAHSEIKRFDSPEVEPYDRYQPKLQARSAALIQEWCDCVFFCNYRTVVAASDVGFNQSVKRGISTGERLIYTNERPAYLAKNRYSLPDTLPLSWDAFQNSLTK